MKAFLLVLLIVYLSGCSTAYYKTKHDREYHINKEESVFIFQPTESTLEDKQFAQLLAHALKNNGFNIAQKAKCGFVFNLEEPTYNNIGSYTSYNTSNITTYTSGFVGGKYVYGNSTSSISTPTTTYYTYSTTYKKIYLDFVCLKENTLEYVFNGFASTQLNEYDKNQVKMVDNLIVLMDEDEDYNGYLRIEGNHDIKNFLQKNRAKNLILVNADIGFGILKGKMNDRISLSSYGYYDDITGIDSALNIPINIRIGYLRKLRDEMYLGANIVYTKNFSESMDIDTDGSYEYGKNFYSLLNGADVKSNQLGVEIMGIAKGFLLGIGLSKDIESSLAFPVNATNIIKDVNAIYMPIRLGYLYNIKTTNFGLSAEFSSSIPLSGAS